MQTITLHDIKATQSKLTEMIAAFERQPQALTYTVPAASIDLAPGERYAGLVLAEDGTPSHHLVLLPGSVSSVGWDAALTWAEEAGGELPSRQEQALLYANLKGEFEARWYWSGEAHKNDGSYAWIQYFNYGFQDLSPKSYEGSARAVRRFPA